MPGLGLRAEAWEQKEWSVGASQVCFQVENRQMRRKATTMVKRGNDRLLGRGALTLAVILGTLLLLTGCSGFVDHDQKAVVQHVTIRLEPGHPVGQTFVARHGGLTGIELWLDPQPGSSGVLRFHLCADSQCPTDLAEVGLTLDQVSGPGFYRFSFSPDDNSHGVYRYAFLELDGVGTVLVGAAPGEVYLDGAAYRDHEPLDAQLAFQLVYDPMGMAVELTKALFAGVGLLALTTLLYVVPGYALLAWLLPDTPMPWPARMGLATGVSLAVYPLLLLWTDLVGLHLGSLYAWLPVVGGLVALALRYRHWHPRYGWEDLRGWVRSDASWPDLTLLVVLTLVFGVRLLVVRGLDAPMWGDSYQHAMIAQLLVDHGGLFDSWEPYAELQTFTYHFGFHGSVAAFHWLTGMPVYRATLWVGQLLNGLAVLALYPLAVRVTRERWSAVVAILVAGLLLPMPMYYVNWGRYTQLAGQVILPVAAVLTWDALEAPHLRRGSVVLTWLVVGGLALTHYRVLIFYVIFVGVWAALNLKRWQRAMSRVALVGSGGALLFLPWFLHTFAGRITSHFGRQLTTPPAQLSSFTRQYNAIGDITRFMPPVGWLVLVVAIGVGLWRRRRPTLLIVLWWSVLLLATNPHWFDLPGAGAISNFAYFIAIYIPAGILIGDLVGLWLSHRPHWSMWSRPVVAGGLVLLGLLGFRTRMRDVQVAAHALVTRPDVRAMAWIRENTPRDARFLINSFFAYGGSAVVGADAGWWLPLLAERANTVPPLNYGSEQGPRPNYPMWVNRLTAKIGEEGLDSPKVLRMLRERDISHVYIGQRQGRVNYSGPDVLSPIDLLHSQHYRLLYHEDRVWVFEVAW